MAKLDGLNDLALTFADPAWASALQPLGVQGFQSGAIREQLESLPAQFNAALQPLCVLVGVPFSPNNPPSITLAALDAQLQNILSGINAATNNIAGSPVAPDLSAATSTLVADAGQIRISANTLRAATVGGVDVDAEAALGACSTAIQASQADTQIASAYMGLQDTGLPINNYASNVRFAIGTAYNNNPGTPPLGTVRTWGNADAQFVAAVAAAEPGTTPLTCTFDTLQGVIVGGNWNP